MKSTKTMALVILSLMLPVAAIAYAQAGANSSPPTDEAPAMRQSCGMAGMMAADQQCETSSCGLNREAFASLEHHFESMMAMDSTPELKAEMTKHHQMMMAMYDPSMVNQSSCKGAAGTCGMMGGVKPESAAPSQGEIHSAHH